MFKRFYCWLHDKFSSGNQRGEYSAGIWQEKVRRTAVDLLRGQNGNILEVGCGEGLFLVELARSNPASDIYGVDFNQERLIAAEARINNSGFKRVNLALQQAPNINFKDAEFDAVVCVNVFFNMPSLEVVKETLLQARRILKNNGRIIFDFRNSLNPLLFLKYRFAKYYDPSVKNLPLNTFAPGAIERILQELSFEITNKKFIDPVFFNNFAPVIVVEARKR